MVETASGAGAQTASMKISGSLDTTNIERGFDRVKSGFNNVKSRAKGFTSDLAKMKGTAKGLASNLTGVAVAGGSALTALATKAPATAGAMAKIGVGMQKLTFAAGKSLAPAFNNVAGWLDKFADWTDSHPKIFSGLATTLGGLAVLKFTGIGSLLGSLASTTVGASVLSALGYLAAIAGAGALAYKGASSLVDSARDYTGMNDENYKGDQSGQTLLSRFAKKSWSDISQMNNVVGGAIPDYTAPWEDPLNPHSQAFSENLNQARKDVSEGRNVGGQGLVMNTLPEQEKDRKFFLLGWWDSMWG